MIEVRGVNFGNKGAQLMLIAVVEHFAAAQPDVQLAVDHSVGSYRDRSRLGLCQKIWFDRLGPFGGTLGHVIPVKLRDIYGLVKESEIHAILDASGFAYTDQWGPSMCRATAKLIVRWRRQGKKTVFLPQAFGPFQTEETRQAFRTILANADLVFARDPVSYEHACSVGGDTSRVRTAPDFTSAVKPILPDYFAPEPRRGCIIPNTRMIDKSPDGDGASYLPFLANCVKALAQKDIDPFILIHETGDEDLARQLCSEANYDVKIVREPDPRFLKGILGACFVVIGSRFHALAGALSQNIPCLAAGWSHKYRMLFEDYGCPECLVSPDRDANELAGKLEQTIRDPGRTGITDKLQKANAQLERQVTEMWAAVHEVLGI